MLRRRLKYLEIQSCHSRVICYKAKRENTLLVREIRCRCFDEISSLIKQPGAPLKEKQKQTILPSFWKIMKTHPHRACTVFFNQFFIEIATHFFLILYKISCDYDNVYLKGSCLSRLGEKNKKISVKLIHLS